MRFVEGCWYKIIAFLCPPSVPFKVQILYDQHSADMHSGLLIILKCFSTRFAHLISSASHWLTLSQGKEKQFLKI